MMRGSKTAPAKKLHFAQHNTSAIDAIIQNFPTHVQKVMEACYLVPLENDSQGMKISGTKPLKENFIEREIYGGMHAGRMGHYIEINHRFISEFFPDFIAKAEKLFKKAFNLSLEQVLMLIILAGVCLNSKRKGEAIRDFSEGECGEYTKNFLLALQVNEDLATLLSLAILHIDKPDAFKAYLISGGISASEVPVFDYIRKLIYLADSFDRMRQIEDFELSHPLIAFKAIPGYSEQHKEHVISLAKAIYEIIHKQGDLLFRCKITDEDGHTLLDSEDSHFRTKVKIQFEHADNVYLALGESFLENPFLAKYLRITNTSKATLCKGLPSFRPFIHGTTSLIFVSLPKTGWAMDSSTKLLEKFKWASEGGEISEGGLNYGATCHICFGRLSTPGNPEYAYTLDKIIGKYTKSRRVNPEALIKETKKYVRNTSHDLLKNINVISILFGRLNQAQINISKEIFSSEKKAGDFLAEIDAIIQLLYLVLLLKTHIHPDFDVIKSWNDALLRAAIHTKFQTKSLIKEIIENKIDIRAAYTNPTSENLSSVLKCLEIPAHSDLLCNEAPFNLFNLKATTYPVKPRSYSMGSFLVDESPFSSLLYHFALGDGLYFQEFHNNSYIQLIERLEKGAKLVREMLYQKSTPYKDEEKFFLENPFPLILISENEEKISLDEYKSQEYRAYEPLVIGQDITMIATDTKEHANVVLHFLKHHHINNVSVILFEDLKKAKETGIKPEPIIYEPSQSSLKSAFVKPPFYAFRKIKPSVADFIQSPGKHPYTVGILVALYILLFSKLLLATFVGVGLTALLSLRNRHYNKQPLDDMQRSLDKNEYEIEDEAYTAGLDAGVNWTSYFKSYSSKAAWKKPLFYGAGLIRAQEESYQEQLKARW